MHEYFIICPYSLIVLIKAYAVYLIFNQTASTLNGWLPRTIQAALPYMAGTIWPYLPVGPRYSILVILTGYDSSVIGDLLAPV